jgi:NADH-quinone oxidoreductase subunit N
MSAAPFHMWTPDVYEGAPTPITAFFAAAPKVAAVALMARLLYEPFLGMADQWRQVIIVLSAISMLLGSFAALMQTNLKRLMAYSSIANMGFALMALASGRAEEGVSAALLYLAFYLPATIGIFALIMSMRRDEAAGGGPAENIDDLAGLAQRRPLMAALFTMLLFSVAGIPPFVGFFGKFIVFREAIEGGLVPLAIIGGVAAVIAAAYYLRILSSIWFKPPALVLQPAGGVTLAMASGAALLTFPVLILALNAVSSWMQALIGPTL